MNQVILNICVNAIHAIGHQEGTIKVSGRTAQAGELKHCLLYTSRVGGYLCYADNLSPFAEPPDLAGLSDKCAQPSGASGYDGAAD